MRAFLILGSSVVLVASLYVFFVGGVAPWAFNPPKTVDEVQSITQLTQPSLALGGLGSLISLAGLAVLILSGESASVSRKHLHR